MSYPGRADGFELYTGAFQVRLSFDSTIGSRRARRERLAAFRRLMRFGKKGALGRRIRPPLVSPRLAGRLRRAVRARRRLGSVRAAARSLGEPPTPVRRRLRLAGALSRLGGIDAARCPRR